MSVTRPAKASYISKANDQNIGSDFTQILSVEVILLILSFLNLKDILLLSSVNQTFNILSKDDYIWRSIYRRYFPNWPLSLENTTHVKSLFLKELSLSIDKKLPVHLNRLNLLIFSTKVTAEIEKALALCSLDNLQKVKDNVLSVANAENNQAFLDAFFNRYVELVSSAKKPSFFNEFRDKIFTKEDDNLCHMAVRCRQIGWINELKKNQPILNQFDSAGNSPLHLACVLGGRTRIVQALLKKVNNIHQTTRLGWTCLHIAASRGDYLLISILRDAGLNVNSQIQKLPNSKNYEIKYFTPLHIAAQNSYPKTAETLLIHGANVNAVASEKQTPLHVAAARFGHAPVIKILLDWEADVTVKYVTADGSYTALDLALRHGDQASTKLLLAADTSFSYRLTLKHFSVFRNSADHFANCDFYFKKGIKSAFNVGDKVSFEQRVIVLGRYFKKAEQEDPNYFQELLTDARLGKYKALKANLLEEFESLLQKLYHEKLPKIPTTAPGSKLA